MVVMGMHLRTFRDWSRNHNLDNASWSFRTRVLTKRNANGSTLLRARPGQVHHRNHRRRRAPWAYAPTLSANHARTSLRGRFSQRPKDHLI